MALVERKDRFLEQIVNRGIVIDAEHGSVIAWVFLYRHGVEPDLILRVLTRPTARRPDADRATPAYAA